mmetsp:Transcript_9911/g.24784  ORF Transcript_9911/g.24784 Transcript_9911/m.24784 type:complete len:320 (-) Transcript_9911:1593-2552(-)
MSCPSVHTSSYCPVRVMFVCFAAPSGTPLAGTVTPAALPPRPERALPASSTCLAGCAPVLASHTCLAATYGQMVPSLCGHTSGLHHIGAWPGCAEAWQLLAVPGHHLAEPVARPKLERLRRLHARRLGERGGGVVHVGRGRVLAVQVLLVLGAQELALGDLVARRGAHARAPRRVLARVVLRADGGGRLVHAGPRVVDVGGPVAGQPRVHGGAARLAVERVLGRVAQPPAPGLPVAGRGRLEVLLPHVLVRGEPAARADAPAGQVGVGRQRLLAHCSDGLVAAWPWPGLFPHVMVTGVAVAKSVGGRVGGLGGALRPQA